MDARAREPSTLKGYEGVGDRNTRSRRLYLPGASKYNFMTNVFSVFIFPALYVAKHLERIARDHTPHGNETPGAASFPRLQRTCGDTGANYSPRLM